MRDALSVLDQLISFSDGTVLTKDVNGMLGVVETQYIFDLADAVASKDCARALTTLDAVIAQGKDIKYLSQNLVEHFRHLMVMKVGGKQLEALIDYPKAHKETLFAQTGNMTIQAILRAIDTLIDAQDTARVTESPRIALELALAKLTCVETPSLSQPVQPSAKPAAPTASARPTGTTAAPKPVVRSSVPPKPTGPAVSGGSVISNKKGSLDLSPLEIPAVPSDSGKSSISLADLKQRWNELTFAVSQKRMSTGTYLQEGFPSTLENGKLVIAFSREHKFHKECLGTVENLNLIAEVFAGILGERFFVELVVVDNAVRDGSAEVKDALEMFRGEVVNEWHSEDA
jgi:DNA polymerase-3 subunit gamma/tau